MSIYETASSGSGLFFASSAGDVIWDFQPPELCETSLVYEPANSIL